MNETKTTTNSLWDTIDLLGNRADDLANAFISLAPSMFASIDVAIEPTIFATLSGLSMTAVAFASNRLPMVSTKGGTDERNAEANKISGRGKIAAQNISRAAVVFAIGLFFSIVLDGLGDLDKSQELGHKAREPLSTANAIYVELNEFSRPKASISVAPLDEARATSRSLLQAFDILSTSVFLVWGMTLLISGATWFAESFGLDDGEKQQLDQKKQEKITQSGQYKLFRLPKVVYRKRTS